LSILAATRLPYASVKFDLRLFKTYQIANGGSLMNASSHSSPVSHSSSPSTRLLDAGFNLTLRPMRYSQFYDMYRDAIRNTWTVEEVDFSLDVNDLRNKFGPAERHLIERSSRPATPSSRTTSC
jgi:hypothetical protein